MDAKGPRPRPCIPVKTCDDAISPRLWENEVNVKRKHGVLVLPWRQPRRPPNIELRIHVSNLGGGVAVLDVHLKAMDTVRFIPWDTYADTYAKMRWWGGLTRLDRSVEISPTTAAHEQEAVDSLHVVGEEQEFNLRLVYSCYSRWGAI